MNNENHTHLTLLEACTLLARETASMLEGADMVSDSAACLREALALACEEPDLGDEGTLLAWVDTEMENAKRFARTGKQTAPLVKLDTPLPMPDPAMQLEAVCVLLKAAARQDPTGKQWQTMLDAVRMLAEMDDLDGMVLGGTVPAGGFLSAQHLQEQLESVKAAIGQRRPR